MQLLIEDVKRMEQGLDVEELSAYVYKKATELLETEREQIEEAHNAANINWRAGSPTPITDGYTYYKETYG